MAPKSDLAVVATAARVAVVREVASLVGCTRVEFTTGVGAVFLDPEGMARAEAARVRRTAAAGTTFDASFVPDGAMPGLVTFCIAERVRDSGLETGGVAVRPEF